MSHTPPGQVYRALRVYTNAKCAGLCLAAGALQSEKGCVSVAAVSTTPVRIALVAIVAMPIIAGAESSTCRDAIVGRVVATADGLQVDESNIAELKADDVLLQLNGHPLRSCADLTTALAEDRRRQLALLLLVGRGQDTLAVLLPSPAATVSTRVTTPAATELPKSTPTLLAVAPSDADAVRGLLTQLRELGRAMQRSLPLLTSQPWARQVSTLRRAYDQRLAAVPTVRTVEPILDDYETVVEILAYREEAVRAEGNARPQPNVSLRYNTGSPVTGWLRRYPFLQASVVEPPEKTAFTGWAEGNGLWSPDRAVERLVEHALADADTLATRLETLPGP